VKYKALVNDHYQLELNQENLDALDIVVEGDRQFHIIQDGKTYKAKVNDVDFKNKLFHITVNGSEYSIKLNDKFDQLISALGLEVTSSSKIKEVKAPMPGLVLDINVSPGQEITKGDKLLVLEAMKMENVIKSSGEGIVKEVHIGKGVAVEKGQLLIEME